MLANKISSSQNPHIKNAIRLRDRKARTESGLTLVEGYRELLRAQEAGVSIEELFICPELIKPGPSAELVERLRKAKTPVIETTESVFSKISFGDREEGLLAVCLASSKGLEQIRLSRVPFLVVADKVEKPGNLGAIIRTCDAAGVDGLIVTDAVTDIYNPNVIRASLGTVFSVSVVQATAAEALRFLKKNAISVYAAHPAGKLNYSQADLSVPLALVVGSEHAGLSDPWTRNATSAIKIPMKGHSDSLNVSTSAAIIIYETLRQRNLKNEAA